MELATANFSLLWGAVEISADTLRGYGAIKSYISKEEFLPKKR